MIVRKLNDNSIVIPKLNLSTMDEATFVAMNSGSGYMLVDKLPTQEKGGLYYKYNDTNNTIEVDTEKNLEYFKSQKLIELNDVFNKLKTTEGKIFSNTINQEINAREKDIININGLIDLLSDTSGTLQYRCYDDETYVEVNVDDLINIKKEISNYGLECYAKKWAYENTIKSVTSQDELDNIEFIF